MALLVRVGCTSHQGASRDLCAALASVTRRCPLLASRLIALNNNPGVRPIGIGDTARRIMAKAVMFIAAPDVRDATGCLQLCGGQMSGVSTQRDLRTSRTTSGCHNCINRQVALRRLY